jgi:hypothetical protein
MEQDDKWCRLCDLGWKVHYNGTITADDKRLLHRRCWCEWGDCGKGDRS